jgi:arylsulfatase A-like enzyme
MFVYLHTAEPHAPYLPRAGFAGRFDPDFTGQLPLQPRSGFPIVRSVRDLERARASYDEEVLYADDRLGAFLAALDRLGVRPRATILVTADHGEELNDHGAWGHGPSLYEEVLRTPLVVAGAGIPPSGRIARPAQLYDVMPTILELAGVALPYALEGESLVPLLRDAAVGARASGRPIVVAHHRFWARGVLEYAVIDSRRWKLVFRYEPQTIPPAPPSRFQLFDLKADPDETSNLVMAHPEVTRRLVGELLAYAERQPRIVQPAESAATLDYDPEQLEQLRALGYVE